jgi:hypothetical protein
MYTGGGILVKGFHALKKGTDSLTVAARFA